MRDDLTPGEFIQWSEIVRETTRPDDTGYESRRWLEELLRSGNSFDMRDLNTALRRLWR